MLRMKFPLQSGLQFASHRPSRRLPIGIDVGRDRMTFVDAKVEGETVAVQSVRTFTMPSEVEGDLSSPVLAMLLRSVIKSSGWTGRAAAFHTPSNQFILRHMSLPKMPQKAMTAAVKMELLNGSMLPFDDPQYDFCVATEDVVTAPMDADMQDVIVVAVPRMDVKPYADLFRKAGLRPKLCEPVLLSAYRIVAQSNDTSTLFGVICLMPQGVQFGVFDRDMLIFMRHIELDTKNYVVEDAPQEPLVLSENAYAADLMYELERSLSFVRYNLLMRDDTVDVIYMLADFPYGETLCNRLNDGLDLSFNQILPTFQRGGQHLQAYDETTNASDAFNVSYALGCALSGITS